MKFQFSDSESVPPPTRFMLLIKSIVYFQDRLHIKVSQSLRLRFYRSNSLMLFCSPLHVHLSSVKHLLLPLFLWSIIGKTFIKFCLRKWTFKSQCPPLSYMQIHYPFLLAEFPLFRSHTLATKIRILHTIWTTFFQYVFIAENLLTLIYAWGYCVYLYNLIKFNVMVYKIIQVWKAIILHKTNHFLEIAIQ